MKIMLGLAALVLWAGCGGENSPIAAPVETSDEVVHPLVGTWQTIGVDRDLGEVMMSFHFGSEGSLEVAIRSAGGIELRFPGTWTAVEGVLVLRGAYFQPDGLQRVSYEFLPDDILVFANEAGRQEWVKQE